MCCIQCNLKLVQVCQGPLKLRANNLWAVAESENFLKGAKPNVSLYYDSFNSLYKWNNKNLLLKRFTSIFLLTYTLNAPKINDLYMIKKSILKGK